MTTKYTAKYWHYCLSASLLILFAGVWQLYDPYDPYDPLIRKPSFSHTPPPQNDQKPTIEFLRLSIPSTKGQKQEIQHMPSRLLSNNNNINMQVFDETQGAFDERIARMFARQYQTQVYFKNFSDMASINHYLLAHPLSIAMGMPISEDDRFVNLQSYWHNHLLLIGPTKNSIPKALMRIPNSFSARTGLLPQPTLSIPSYQEPIAVLANNPHTGFLKHIFQDYADYTLVKLPSSSLNDIVGRLLDETFKYAIVNASDWSAINMLYPSLETKLMFNADLPIVWRTSENMPPDWVKKIQDFFINLRNSGKLLSLAEKSQPDLSKFDHLDLRYFYQRVNTRLRPLIPYFKKASTETQLPWTLLAALSYQESQWYAKAVSSTGARGLMMINAVTAKQLAMPANADEEQQILYGARYFKMLYDALSYIREDDRVFFSLVAYNSGPGALSSLIRELVKNKQFSYQTKDVVESVIHNAVEEQAFPSSAMLKKYRSKSLISVSLPLLVWQKMNWISLRQYILKKSSTGRYSSQSVILTERVRIFYTLLKHLDQMGKFEIPQQKAKKSPDGRG